MVFMVEYHSQRNVHQKGTRHKIVKKLNSETFKIVAPSGTWVGVDNTFTFVDQRVKQLLDIFLPVQLHVSTLSKYHRLFSY